MKPDSIQKPPDEPKELISDADLINMYDNIMETIDHDRKQLDEVLTNFIDMVMNEGDGSTASKEAIVNLIKVKLDSADKMAKIAELKTRVKLKDMSAPAYLFSEHNKFQERKGLTKREVLRAVATQQKKEKDDDQPS